MHAKHISIALVAVLVLVAGWQLGELAGPKQSVPSGEAATGASAGDAQDGRVDPAAPVIASAAPHVTSDAPLVTSAASERADSPVTREQAAGAQPGPSVLTLPPPQT